MSEIQAQENVAQTEIMKKEEALVCNTEYRYRQMFKSLGFDGDIVLTKVLRCKGKSIKMFFNRNIEGKIYFTANEKDYDYSPENLWFDVNGWQIKSKDKEKGKVNIIPVPGREKEAFIKVLIHYGLYA